jgi:hypothetical protein
MAELTVYELDGDAFKDLAGFAGQFSATVLRGYRWTGNLDAFNDILRGGFGTPEDGFTLRIKNAAAARTALGYSATSLWLEERAQHCHPSNRDHFVAQLEDAREGKGPTLFEMLVGIIRDHGPGGSEADDNVLLELDDESPPSDP